MTKRKYREYTDSDIIQNSKIVYSLSSLLVSLNLKPRGSNFINMKKNLQRLNVDTSHWTGQAWSKGKQLKDYSEYTRAHRIKPHLINERGHSCEKCNLTHWNSYEIPLELHHIDGDKTNNSQDNLQLLCPNCHAQTDNWRNRKSN